MSERSILTVTNLNHFTQPELKGFFMTVRQILGNVYADAPDIAQDLIAALNAYDSVILRDDLQTSQVANADREADEAWSALNALIKAMILSKNSMRREAAERVYAVFSKFENPTKLSYNREYAVIENQLSALASCSTSDLEACYLIEPIQYLQDACTNFQKIVASYAEAKSQVNVGDAKTKRVFLIDTWRKFVKRCNAIAEWQNDAKLNDFIAQVNVIIAQKNAADSAAQTKKSNKTVDSSDKA